MNIEAKFDIKKSLMQLLCQIWKTIASKALNMHGHISA